MTRFQCTLLFPFVLALGCNAGADLDEDGHSAATDCDDTRASVHPDADEVCNGIDDDCDGVVDEEASDATTWYADADGDGHGDAAETSSACTPPSGYAAVDGDCDDTNAWIHPGAREDDCTDPIDYNCDGSVGYADEDQDGYAACADCDDATAAVNAAAEEVCNDIDDDCDGETDENSTDAPAWYADADGDGHGNARFGATACTAPDGYVESSDDCDDLSPAVSPSATETCNGTDDDCDGDMDEDDASDASTWYADSDGDGYGDATTTAIACSAPSNHVADSSDCDDTSSAISPATSEICNLVDDDCDGSTDEDDATDASTWYADVDGDGHGGSVHSTTSCTQPIGYVATGDDCDDTNSLVAPSIQETCNGTDDDCDGTVDESDAADAATWYADADSDGFGDSTTSTVSCAAPSNYVADSTDCIDTNGSIHPDAAETNGDGVDSNCDGSDDTPHVTCVGDTSLYSDAAATTYCETCTHQAGDIYLEGSGVTDPWASSCLEEVDGSLTIWDTTLASIEMSSLTAISQNLDIEANSLLSDISSLHNISSIGGWLFIEDNALTACQKLDFLAAVGESNIGGWYELSISAESTCDDSLDDDCDGDIDCDDSDCAGDSACSSCTPTEIPESTCNDAIDNDCDGDTDSADTDCSGSCTPTEIPEQTCNDGVDNDCDGDIDSADTDC